MSTAKKATKRKRAQVKQEEPEAEAPNNNNTSSEAKQLSEQYGKELEEKLMNAAKKCKVQQAKDLPKALENLSSLLKEMNNSTADKIAPLFEQLSKVLGNKKVDVHIDIKDGQVFFTPPLTKISITGFHQIHAEIVQRIELKSQLQRVQAILSA